MGIIKPGARCRVIGRIDRDTIGSDKVVFDKLSPNYGKEVIVIEWVQERESLGNIWNCKPVKGEIITSYGVRAISAYFAGASLQVIDDPLPNVMVEEKLVVNI